MVLTLIIIIVKQFIRNVRAAKTIADERAVIQKESAAIRASFREETHDHNIRYDFSRPLSAHDTFPRLDFILTMAILQAQ